MSEQQPFHAAPWEFPDAVPASQLQYWLDFQQNFKGDHPIRTAFGDDDNLLPLDPPLVNSPPEAGPAPFNGPFPIKSKNLTTGRISQEIGAGVFIGFKLLGGEAAWDPQNWCAVYGKMGKYQRKNFLRPRKGPGRRRPCRFSAKNRNYLSADTELGTKSRAVDLKSIVLIKSLHNSSKEQVEDYVAKGETRARKYGLREFNSQMLHLRSLQHAHLLSLPATPRRDRYAAQYNR